MRILVVDGNLAVQEILFDILTMSGQKAGMVGSIDDAAKCLTRFKPEAIFLDAGICVTSFLDAVDRDLADARPKIFMLSDDDPPKDTSADGYIRKPLKSDDVLEVVSSLEGKDKELLMKELVDKIEASKVPDDETTE